ADGLPAAIASRTEAAKAGPTTGRAILVFSDENVSAERAPVPSLLAVGAVNTALLESGHRTRTSLVVQTDDARESHHFACLLGYGAEAVYPRLALATAASMASAGRVGEIGSLRQALLQYRTAIEEGVLKILS